MSKQEDLPVIEPVAVPEIFLDGLLPAQDMGDFVKITGYSVQRLSGDAEPVRVVVIRVIWPKEAYLAAREVMDSTIRPSCRLTLVK